MTGRTRRGALSAAWDRTRKAWDDLDHLTGPEHEAVRAGLRHQAKMGDDLYKSGESERSAKVVHAWVSQLLSVGPAPAMEEHDDPWDALAAHLREPEVVDAPHSGPSD